MTSTITQLLLFKDLCTLSRGPDIEPLSCQNLIGVGLCEGKVGCFDVVVVIIILFLKDRAKNPKSFSCQTNRIWKKYVHRQHIYSGYFPSSTLKMNLCTSRRTQLQHSF